MVRFQTKKTTLFGTFKVSSCLHINLQPRHVYNTRNTFSFFNHSVAQLFYIFIHEEVKYK